MSDYDAQGSAVLNKWQREEERKKSRAAAMEENFKKTFAEAIKQPSVKKTLAREAKNAVDSPNSRNPLFDSASHGTSRGYNDGEVITGNEPRPWEE